MTGPGTASPPSFRPGPSTRALLAVLRAYQRWLSPLLGPRCRFAPTCSSYAATALAAHGTRRGGWLALRRLLRCHPFHPGGYDPVPPRGRPSGRHRHASEASGVTPC